MTKPGLFASVFALLLTGACTADDAPAETETGTETAGTETTGDGDGDGDGDCTPPAGVYADCVNGGLAACMSSGSSQCVMDDPNMPSVGVCGRPCNDDCDCWAAPADGDAPSSCKPLVQGDDGTCVLDCSGGQTCPSGMICLESLEICVF